MDTSLIAVLVAVALVILLLVLKKSSGKKTPSGEVIDEDVSSTSLEETLAGEEEAIGEPDGEDEPVDIVAGEEELSSGELDFEEVLAAEPLPDDEEPVVAAEAVDSKSVEEHAGVDELTDALAPEEEDVPPVVPEVEEEPVTEESQSIGQEVIPVVSITLAAYEQQLKTRKEQRMADLTEAIAQNEEGKREQLQAELVAITESLSFVETNYEQDVVCRTRALELLGRLSSELDSDALERARTGLCEGDTREAEQVFAGIVKTKGPDAAQAAYQIGSLAERRMELQGAMQWLDQAVALDNTQPDYLRSAGLLARRLYLHKKALAMFTALAKGLGQSGEDTLELALARREQAYSLALVGQHKQAGGLYKQAMVSLMKLSGKDSIDMGISWLQIGKLQEAIGQYEKAEDPYLKSLAIMEKYENHPVLGENLDKLAGLYMELEREREAIPVLERLCAFKEKSTNPDLATLTMAYGNLAEACRISGDYETSEKNYKKALAITEKLRGKEHAAVGSILQELVQLCERQGKADEAKAYGERAAKIFQRVLEEQEAKGQEASNLSL